jgi:hypothetical protein
LIVEPTTKVYKKKALQNICIIRPYLSANNQGRL